MSSPRPMAPSSGTPGDFGSKAHAAGALDAAVHRRLDKRAEIFVLDRALVLMEAAGVDAIGHRLVLQVTFAALVANRTIERVVDQQKFHHAFARLAHHRRAGGQHFRRAVLVRHQVLHRHGAGGLRLRHAGDFDQAHPAITGDRQPLVKTEARDFRAASLAGLEQRILWRDIDLVTVDDDLGHCRLTPPPQ
jgi:hypothetical protein